MRRTATLAVGLLFASAGIGAADEPRPVPLTRPEMKQYLEDMKARKPRIPLPELTEEEKAKLGERGGGYESRIRSLYLPTGDGFGFGGGSRTAAGGNAGDARRPDASREPGAARPATDFTRNSDPNMSLDYAFKTELFWIASRANNCQYCLGHQESKLLRAGLNEDVIAALDGDWAEFDPAQRAAFAFARKLTYEPDKLTDADIAGLRKHYQDLQILEMVCSVAGNNAINRWKEGAGVPQSQGGGGFGSRAENGNAAATSRPATTPHSYLTPTSEKNQSRITRVAPVWSDPATGEPTKKTISTRPSLESWPDVEKALDAARKRAPRLPLLDEAKARSVVSSVFPEGPLPLWVRLVTNFPREGMNRINTVLAADAKGELKPLLKAQVSWITARQDRAWYATGIALKRLKELGQTDKQVAALDGDWSEFSPADRAMFTVARKLAASPVVLTDADVDAALKLTSPRDVVQLIHFTTTRAWFDRVTEAAGLPLEP